MGGISKIISSDIITNPIGSVIGAGTSFLPESIRKPINIASNPLGSQSANTLLPEQLRAPYNTAMDAATGSVIGTPLGPVGTAIGALVGAQQGGIEGFLKDPVGSLSQGVGSLIPEAAFAPSAGFDASIENLRRLQNDYMYQAQQQGISAYEAQMKFNEFIRQAQAGVGNARELLQEAISANQQQAGDALGILRGAATGEAPSAAQAQLRAGLDEAIRTQQSLANSGQISGMVGRQKEAMQNAAQLSQQAANQAAQLRAQEMAAARGQYGQQAAQYAAQAGQNVGQGANLANIQSGLAQQQAGIMGQRIGAQQNTLGLAGNIGQARTSAEVGKMASQQQAEIARQQMIGQAIGGLLGGVGSAGTAAAAAAAAEGGIVPEGMTNHQDGNFVNRQAMYKNGGKIPGRAKKEGDSYENDNMHILVSPGEIIIPRSHCESPEKAIEFIREIMETKKENPKEANVKMFLDTVSNSKVIENGREVTDPKKKKEKIQVADKLTDEVDDIVELMEHLARKKK